MVDRRNQPDPAWVAVDHYIENVLIGTDAILSAALVANAAAGLPDIDVAPVQGRMLYLFARMVAARRILEVGTLGGYSTICLARALPEDGRVISLERDPHHAEIARGNIAAAGLAGLVDIRTGPASETLARMKAAGEGPFDLVFIDADKQGNVAYLNAALSMSRPGTAIIVDNVVREGMILDTRHPDPRVQGTRALFDAIAVEPRLSATAIQTVGIKKWDGFLLALVD